MWVFFCSVDWRTLCPRWMEFHLSITQAKVSKKWYSLNFLTIFLHWLNFALSICCGTCACEYETNKMLLFLGTSHYWQMNRPLQFFPFIRRRFKEVTIYEKYFAYLKTKKSHWCSFCTNHLFHSDCFVRIFLVHK